jgi:peptide/nickel transport system permease protein
MVADGLEVLESGWWVSTVPGLAILFTVLGLNLFGDWIRDYLDPRTRRR